MVECSSDGWRSGPIVVPMGFWGRLVGSPPRPCRGTLVVGRSVHALWMRVPLVVAAIDRSGRVLATGRLHPLRVWSHRGAAAILELPPDRVPPPVGAVLGWRPIPCGDAGPTHPVCHAHRQPR